MTDHQSLTKARITQFFGDNEDIISHCRQNPTIKIADFTYHTTVNITGYVTDWYDGYCVEVSDETTEKLVSYRYYPHTLPERNPYIVIFADAALDMDKLYNFTVEIWGKHTHFRLLLAKSCKQII